MYGLMRGAPVLVWCVGTPHTERSVGRLRRVVRGVLRRVIQNWITYGRSSTEYLVMLGADENRICEIQNCVDDTRLRPEVAPILTLRPRPVRLFYVGQLIGRKGVDLLLEAAARASRRGLEFTLLLVGEGPQEESLEARARVGGLWDVKLLPAQSPTAMPTVYRSADVLIFPTLRDPWGLVVNEALLCGLRVLPSIYAGCAAEPVPEEDRFDPLDSHDFDRAMTMAVTGQLASCDRSSMSSCARVAEMITEGVVRALALSRSKGSS